MPKNPTINEAIDHYLSNIISRETPLLKRLREETSQLPQRQMQITPDQGAFLAMLVRLLGAKHVVEVGTFTGYSALSMAMALPQGGQLIACDMNKEWTDIARRYWHEAGLSARITLKLGKAEETLMQLLDEGRAATFDLAFIDADKNGYDRYYELCLQLLRSGGLITLDNMLWGGAVADPHELDKQTVSLRALNAKIRDDQRVDCCLLPIADGIMLARKR